MPQDREPSRCETCGKRLAYFGPAQPRPCPDEAENPAMCREVTNALVMARHITQATGNTMHHETVELMVRSGWTIQLLDDEIARRARVDADDKTFRYEMAAKDALSDWINGERERAMIVAKWAIDQIDITANGTRTIFEIGGFADEIARDLSEYAEAFASQNFEMEDA